MHGTNYLFGEAILIKLLSTEFESLKQEKQKPERLKYTNTPQTEGRGASRTSPVRFPSGWKRCYSHETRVTTCSVRASLCIKYNTVSVEVILNDISSISVKHVSSSAAAHISLPCYDPACAGLFPAQLHCIVLARQPSPRGQFT